MKISGPLAGFVLVTALYLGALLWLDSQKQVFSQLSRLWPTLLAMAGLRWQLWPCALHAGSGCCAGRGTARPWDTVFWRT